MMMQQRKNKRGLQQLSDAQKMEAITKVQKGETKAAVAREFGVPESTLRGWCKKAKLNGHCHSALNKSLQVTSTMSPLGMTAAEMAYRDCGYSKGSGSDEGSTRHPFSDSAEEDEKPETSRIVEWLARQHYPMLAAQTPPSTYHDNKPVQPVVTSSTCDDIVKPNPKTCSKVYKRNNNNHNNHSNNRTQDKNAGFLKSWFMTGGENLSPMQQRLSPVLQRSSPVLQRSSPVLQRSSPVLQSSSPMQQNSSPVSSISAASSDQMDWYDEKPLELVVPSKRRSSELETSESEKMCEERQKFHNNNNNTINNNCSSKNHNVVLASLLPHKVGNGYLNGINNHLRPRDILTTPHDANENNNDQLANEENTTRQQVTGEEALRHGEMFLSWLKGCSDPNVSVLQAVQIGTLLEKLRHSLVRSQSRQ